MLSEKVKIPIGELKLPEKTDSLDQAKRDLAETGMAIMKKGVMSPDLVARLRDRLLEQAEMEREHGVSTFAIPRLGNHPTKGEVYHQQGSRVGRPLERPPFQVVRFLPNKGPEFVELIQVPEYLELAKSCLQDDLQVISLAGLIVSKGGQTQFLHSDQSVVPFQTYKPVYMNSMIALSDYTADMGATHFVPGSHVLPAPEFVRDGNGHIRNKEVLPSIPAELEAGEFVVWDGRTWHGQGPVTSDKQRVSITTLYAAHYMKPLDNYPASISDESYASLSTEAKELLGFRVVRHGGGSFAARSAEDMRYNTNVEQPFIPLLRRGGDARPAPVGGIVEEWGGNA